MDPTPYTHYLPTDIWVKMGELMCLDEMISISRVSIELYSVYKPLIITKIALDTFLRLPIEYMTKIPENCLPHSLFLKFKENSKKKMIYITLRRDCNRITMFTFHPSQSEIVREVYVALKIKVPEKLDEQIALLNTVLSKGEYEKLEQALEFVPVNLFTTAIIFKTNVSKEAAYFLDLMEKIKNSDCCILTTLGSVNRHDSGDEFLTKYLDLDTLERYKEQRQEGNPYVYYAAKIKSLEVIFRKDNDKNQINNALKIANEHFLSTKTSKRPLGDLKALI